MPSAPNEPTTSAPKGHGRTVRIFLAITASLSLLVGVVGGISFASYKAVQSEGVKTGFYDPDPSASPGADSPTGPCVNNVCNYLILGSDSRQGLTKKQQIEFGTNGDIGGSNRSDTIMLVHSDPSQQKAAIISFPRDLWVNIPGVGPDKINAAFQGGVDGGGPELVAKTVHEITGLRINHFVYVDLAGFQNIVDTLGGVQMCIPAENVNTPGWVSGPDGPVYYHQQGYIADPYTGLLVKPGCQLLHGDQALAYVRTRHLKCDAVPDFARINRQQEFLRAVINRLLQPSELIRAPSLIRPVLGSLKRDDKLTPVDLAFLVSQLQGMSTGAAEFRSVPGTVGTEQPSWSSIPLSVVHMDPSAEQIFAALRNGKPLPRAGTSLEGVEMSAANITVPVVDHDSAGKATGVNTVLADAGFIAPGIEDYATYGADIKGSVIAYEPGRDAEAQVVAKYFPGLKLVETPKDALPGTDVAVFVTAAYTPQQPGERARHHHLRVAALYRALMRALVLSGGEGSRLRPITHTNAKQLIPVAGTPILFHALASISDAGITEVGLVVGPPNEDEVRAAVGDGSHWGLDLVFIHQPAPLGIAHAVMIAADFVRGDPFLLYLGDNVLLEGVARFVEEFERTAPEAQIFLARVPEPEHFGVAILEGERVVRLVEKPKEWISDVALVGVYLFRDSILEACATLQPSWRNEYEITEAIQWLIDNGRTVRAEMVSGWWKDTGKPEDLLEANRMMLSLVRPRVDGEVDGASTVHGAVVIEAGAKVTNSTVNGPVVIGPDCVVDGSVIGPEVSLERGCRVMASTVTDSIVMEGCSIDRVRGLTGSILGRGSDVRHSGGEGAHRLIVGDQSRVEVD